MEKNLRVSWELDVLYKGGSESQDFAAELNGIEQDIAQLGESLSSAAGKEDGTLLLSWTEQMQSILLRLRQSESFVSCLLAQNVKDSKAVVLGDRVKSISARFLGVLTRFDEALRAIDDPAWSDWMAKPEAEAVAFNLNERREIAKEKLPPEQEALAGDLAVDGYHAWGDLYNTIVSRARFRVVTKSGEEKLLSAGQMQNRLSDGNREVRSTAFDEWEREWSEQADLCADALNRIAGFRLKLYERRGWDTVIKEPLQINRMSEATIHAMWSAVDAGKPVLVAFLERKAKLLGLPRLDWHDVEAPIGTAAKTVSFDDAAAFIVERFRAFNPDLADFSEKAFREGWIEAEDRPGKRPGGFCTAFPKSRQTRIFMTYSGTADNIATLAHELGHAYHQHLMDDLPPLAQEYAMNVAETASTFAEMIVADSALQLSRDPQEKLALLEDKIGRSVAFFMNIHARYKFETAFYERRRSGMLSPEEISALMEQAQEEAFSGAIGRKHPHFWASKLHFYLTDVPFYNFPYTFGYLFSSGIYARALAEGPSFTEKYAALLRDTGRMTVEELAYKHLGVRLEEESFWKDAVERATADVRTFLELTAE
ncbi:M3 family oligoendopeptidase [Paenibacillus abyssi]|uniref:Oligoendopeptidase n=1 Tax=Paenibacillus abyssi TaxID=1340531 RepID=A0A917D0K4_9BACL|nr:M3 family oligoendopeptidase [Paenibacillus abyssi]GGG04913.1 oligoendopeptidase [Paenibacillus abyssi]